MNKIINKKGSASALIILVLTVLVLLGVLSLVTVASDLKLAQKRAQWQKEYYQTDSVAVEFYAAIDTEAKKYFADNENINESEFVAEMANHFKIWLSDQDIHEYDIWQEQNELFITASVSIVYPPPPASQMLDLKLSIKPDKNDNQIHLSILEWTQWQTSQPVTEETGVVWIPD